MDFGSRALDTSTQWVTVGSQSQSVLNGTELGEGSSGGPVWLTDDTGNAVVVGVISTGSDVTGAGTFAKLNVTSVNQIAAWMAQDAPPSVNVQNISVAENASVAASSIITSVSNPSGESIISQYGFYDAGGGSGHLTVNGVAQSDDSWVDVTTANLDTVQYVGGSSAGADTLDVEVYDATTAMWSAYSSLTATTTAPHVAPAVSASDVTVAENTAIAAGSLIASISNPSGDSITQYIYKDEGGGTGYFTVNGIIQPDGQWIYPTGSDNVQYIGGASPGADAVMVGIYDYTTNSYSYSSSVTATTVEPAGPPSAPDILWQNTSGSLVDWTMNGSDIVAGQELTYQGNPVTLDSSLSVAGVGDFNGDGKPDILLRNTDGSLVDWTMNGSDIVAGQNLTYQGNAVALDSSWSVAGVGDFNGDGKSDILWRNANGSLVDWTMNGSDIVAGQNLTYQGNAVALDRSWSVAGVGDFTGDGRSDILWRNSNGSLVDWTMNGSDIVAGQDVTYQGNAVALDSSWSVAAVGDFSGDGKSDILWRNSNGSLVDWTMNGSEIVAGQQVTYQGSAVALDSSWSVAAVGDFNGASISDILWRNTSGNLAEWAMNGSTISSGQLLSYQGYSVNLGSTWHALPGQSDFG